MSQLKTTKVYLGDSATLANNFQISVPATPDGTLTLERGDGTDVLTVDATGGVSQKGSVDGVAVASGKIGEVLTASLAIGSAVSLTTNTAVNIAAISLPAGKWRVSAPRGRFLPAATTSITQMVVCVSNTSSTLSDLCQCIVTQAASVSGTGEKCVVGSAGYINITSPTTYYIVVRATFTVSTLTVYGDVTFERVA